MPLDLEKLMATRVDDIPCSYTERDVMLYALGIGFGSDPLDYKELPYVYEGGSLATVPTMASMLMPHTFLDDCGWDYTQVLHGEQRLELYRPLPPRANLLANRRVVAVYDKGATRGAKILVEAEVRQARDDTVLFNLA
ncbi:MAG: FAS1-like dehydratase domain-containing protein, partial [Woeseiaceae bacterium]